MTTPLSLKLALRDLRGGLKGLGIVLACLTLGVAAIAAAGSLDASLRRALSENARALLGGDAEIRLTYRPLSDTETAFLKGWGDLSQSAEMRAMARGADDRRTLVEIKAVDNAYPLYGNLTLNPTQNPADALAQEDGRWGAAVDANLLDRLGLHIGQELQIAQARFVVRATIEREPDRVANAFSFGPRLLISPAALQATGLIQPGSLIRHATLIRLKPATQLADFRAALTQAFPDAGWFIRDSREAAPGLQRFLDTLAQFLALVGLTALLIGGIGVANGVRSFLDGRRSSIAILKCLGASNGLMLRIYGWQITALTVTAVLLGLTLGVIGSWVIAIMLGNRLPVEAHLGLYPLPLLVAAGFGGLTSLTFAAQPLLKAGHLPAAALFRETISPSATALSGRSFAVIATGGIALAALAVAAATDRMLALSFVGVALAAFVLFALAGKTLQRLAHLLASLAGQGHIVWRLALSGLHRPGAPTQSVVLSLGLGLTVLVTIALVQANLNRQLGERMPAQAPSFFFIDIQSDQADQFDQTVAQAGGVVVKRAAMVRGRITRLNDQPVEQVAIAPDAQWAVRGDRGLTTSAEQPSDARIVAGQWWTADYSGPPLVSMDAKIAKGFGLKVGDRLTINVLGRDITATIANLREIDWTSLSMNFTFILTPSALAGAPHTDIATVHAPAGLENQVERAVTDALPGLSSIRVKEALEELNAMVRAIAAAISGAAAIALTAGGLVLAGTVAAGQRRRIREAVILKVLGAKRRDLLRALLLEYALLGGAAALVATLLGAVAAWAVLTFILKADWVLLPLPALATALASVLGVMVMGWLGTSRALKVRPAPFLRNE